MNIYRTYVPKCIMTAYSYIRPLREIKSEIPYSY